MIRLTSKLAIRIHLEVGGGLDVAVATLEPPRGRGWTEPGGSALLLTGRPSDQLAPTPACWVQLPMDALPCVDGGDGELVAATAVVDIQIAQGRWTGGAQRGGQAGHQRRAMDVAMGHGILQVKGFRFEGWGSLGYDCSPSGSRRQNLKELVRHEAAASDFIPNSYLEVYTHR